MPGRRTTIAIAFTLSALTAADAAAQGRFEVQPFVGTRFGGGFDAGAPLATPFLVPVDFSLDSGLAWGFTVGVFVSQPVEFEFMLSRQESGISVDGARLFDAAITQYHGNVLFHFTDEDEPLRPYFLVGLGATTVSPDATIDGTTKFSFGVGGGVKYYFTDTVGIRAQGRLAPTYVRDEPALFCDFYCYAVETADYAYQGEFTVGVSLRF